MFFFASYLAELGRSHSLEVKLRLRRTTIRLTLALQAGHTDKLVLRAVEPLAVDLEPVAWKLVAPGLQANPPLHHTHALGAVRAAEYGGLVVVTAARARAAPMVLARFGGHVHARRGLVILAEPPHTVGRVSEVRLLPAP